MSTAKIAAVEAGSPAGAAPASVATNARWGLLASAVYALGLWVQYAIIARVGGASTLGGYAYVLALAAPVVSLASLQLGVLQVSDARDVSVFREYRTLRLLTTGVALAVVVGLARIGGAWSTLWPMVLAVCALRGAEALADIYGSLWQKTERLSTPNVATMLNASVSVAFMGAAAVLGGGAAVVACCAALGAFASLLFLHVSTVRDGPLRAALTSGARPGWRAIGRLAVQGAPMGLIVLLLAVHANAPRYFIRHHSGDAALGLFAAAGQLTGTGLLVVNAVGAAAIPRLARLLQARQGAAFRKLVWRASVGCVALGGAGIGASALVGRAVLAAIYQPEFAHGAGVLVVLSIASTFAFPAAVLGYALTAARVLLAQCWAVAASLAVLVAACAALVPRFGALGAAWAVTAASAVHLAANAIAVHGTLARWRALPAGAQPARPS